MAGRHGPRDFAACARCGSGQVHPKLLVMGPIAGIDSDSRSFVCHACGHEGLPIFFDTAEGRAQFEREKGGLWASVEPGAKKGSPAIPLLPIQTDPLFDVKILDRIPARTADVTGVRWDGGRLHPTAYRASHEEYWAAVGGSRYNASRILLIDLAGINRADPNFEVARHLAKRCEVWLDAGGREPEEILDGYMVDVERVVAATKTLVTFETFGALYALSNEVLPCIDWDGRVVWLDPREGRADLREVAKGLREIGFRSACVMDLRRLGTELGPDPAFLALLEGLDLDLYVGGGLQEADVLRLSEQGFAGGLVDPFTPVIRDLLPKAPKPGTPTEAKAPAPKPQPKPSPAPGSVPDPA
ncbi:MAG TPA: HisA/HisF-related TIM barrel protein [Thermoplasmata archaeon]|nr:HisA/HisF-related TIM barrel protein [Thermoplasmata archaeon]